VHEDEVAGADQQREQCHPQIALRDDQTDGHREDRGGPQQVVEPRGLPRRIAVEVARERQDQPDLRELRGLDPPFEEPALTAARHGREGERRQQQQRRNRVERQRQPFEVPVVDTCYDGGGYRADDQREELAVYFV
jgi:hypothetical protein